MVDADELAEWAYVFDHRYGSPKEPIKIALREGRDMAGVPMAPRSPSISRSVRLPKREGTTGAWPNSLT